MCKRLWDGLPGTKLAGIAVFVCLFLSASARAQSPFDIGISVHLAGNPGMLPSALSLISQAGANSVRDDVPWAQVERVKGQLTMPSGVDDLVDQALKANVQPLLILDYGNPFYDSGAKPVSPQALSAFARYAVFVVQHFKGRVHRYEMWNEWNVTTGGTRSGTPQEYVQFLRVVYPAVKAIDPSAVFIAGAIGGIKLDWLSAMLSAGAIGSFDALSIHPYNFGRSTRTGDVWAQDMLATEAAIHRYTDGRDIPLYITEMGWPTYSGSTGISPKQAGVYLAQMFLLARTMTFIKGIWWYDFRDDGWDASNKENDFGLVDPNLKPKPAFAALATVVPIVRDTLGVEDLPTGGPSLRALRFRLHGDNQVIALWSTSQAGLIRVHVTGSVPLQVRSIEPESSVDATAPTAKEGTIQISDMPVLVSGASLALKSVN
jgi:polysaccharide biosynthesis protein PslG